MIYFNCDYTEGAHPSILKYISETNYEQLPGYGEDHYCDKARGLIKEACGRSDVDVHFLVGGTQVNRTVVSAALRPHQAVLSSAFGHVNTHETGAIEAVGHKVITISNSDDGKLTAQQVISACNGYKNDSAYEHIVQPKMVYISHPTENGMLYNKAELEALRSACDAYGLYLFLDGARLSYALAAEDTDVTLSDIARLCDVFYIGGTKTGALFGEAVVITAHVLKEDFRCIMKQNGAMLAKGWLLGLQFCALFKDSLYYDIASRADAMACEIARACKSSGFHMLTESVTNQQFPIFPNDVLKQLQKQFVFSVWKTVDDKHTAARICTSWATTHENADLLIDAISKYGQE